MEILRIVYEWPPPWDGLVPAPYEITKSQLKLDHTFHIFCGRWPKAGQIEKLPNVRLHPLIREPLPGTLLITIAPFVLFKYFRWKKNNKVDLIHSHGHFGAWIYLYRYLLQKFHKSSEELKTPLVVNFHNTVKGRWEAAKNNNIKIKFYSKYLNWPLSMISDKLAVRVADACIFVSGEVKEEAINYYEADPEKCYVVESGVNVDDFVPVGAEEKEKTREDLGLDLFNKVILYIGAIVERKNVHLVAESLQFLPQDYKLLLVGTGDRDYMDKVTDFLAEKKLTGRVIWTGYAPYPQVPIAFQAADVLVLPSSWEGLPKVVLEGLASGTPVIASGFKVGEEIEGLRYLTDLNPETIAKEIKDLIENPIFVDVGKVRSTCSWDIRAKQVEEVYKKILESNA